MQFANDLLGNDENSMFNSNGHRCVEIDEINLRKHILIVGDTAGLVLDIPIEQTFPYIISKKLNMDYYNLCVANGGADVIKHNLFVWLSKYGTPKVIIVACEFVNAVMISDTNFSFIKSADLTDPEVESLNHHANYCGFFNGRNWLLDKLISNMPGIPVYQLTRHNMVNLLSSVNDIQCDNLSQDEVASTLYKQITNRFRVVNSI